MLALHARRSAPSIAAWVKSNGSRGLAVVLTGTDVYQDIAVDAPAKESLRVAGRLILLQERGPLALPEQFRGKARVIYPSIASRRTLAKTSRLLRAVMVGHLREVKSPQTLFGAAALLSEHADIRVDHIGAGLEPEFESQALATMAACPNYRWLGALPHESTRGRIQRAHVLIHSSRMEGGAHVVMEAVMSGTPVLASQVDGNVGMLGAGYAGYFPWGNAKALASLVATCRATQSESGGLLNKLVAQIGSRASLFSPDTERAALSLLVSELSD